MAVKKGTFYGVGVGPGDPELLTLKALRVIERCPVIAAPRSDRGGMLALDIVSRAVSVAGKTILPLDLPMVRDAACLRESHAKAADAVAAQLDAGRDVAMLNLGDVSIYATFGYVEREIKARGYGTAMVPGIPSFCAAAARLDIPLTDADAPLHILPAGEGELRAVLALDGTKVLMKAPRRTGEIGRLLQERGGYAALVENCGLEGERVYRSAEEFPAQAGYYTTIIVKE